MQSRRQPPLMARGKLALLLGLALGLAACAPAPAPASGPADLARSLLADHLGTVPPPRVYQAFQRAHVARWPQGQPWTLTSAALDAWLDSSGARLQLEEQDT